MIKVLYVGEWLSDAREKIEEQVETAEIDRESLAEALQKARDAPRPDEVYRVLEERSQDAREALESVREDVTIESEATALLVAEIASTYREDPERAVEDVSTTLEEGVDAAAGLPRKKADGLARKAGWMDFEEFRQAQGYTDSTIDVNMDLGGPYDLFHDSLDETTWDADALARYEIPAPDALDLSVGTEDRAALEDAVGVLGEAYCRTHDLEDVDSVVYSIEERGDDTVVRATFYNES